MVFHFFTINYIYLTLVVLFVIIQPQKGIPNFVYSHIECIKTQQGHHHLPVMLLRLY